MRVWLRETTFDMGASVAKRMESFAAKPAKELDASAIQYSRVWEDHRLLSQGLKTQPGDVVLSITIGRSILGLPVVSQATPCKNNSTFCVCKI